VCKREVRHSGAEALLQRRLSFHWKNASGSVELILLVRFRSNTASATDQYDLVVNEEVTSC